MPSPFLAEFAAIIDAFYDLSTVRITSMMICAENGKAARNPGQNNLT
jgi:hypothetical protein